MLQDDMMFGTVMADPEILQAISGNNPGGKYERSLYRFMRDVQPKSWQNAEDIQFYDHWERGVYGDEEWCFIYPVLCDEYLRAAKQLQPKHACTPADVRGKTVR